VHGTEFDESAFFRAIGASGARALLIGRRAMVALGLPVLTADYDFWIHIDDIAAFNAAALPMGLLPSRTPEEARAVGRYALQNDEHVDVLVVRSVPTAEGQRVTFDDLWSHRRTVEVRGVALTLPSLDGLIETKRIGARPKDLEDIRLLQVLKEEPPE
jgi:hypothetical protein